MNADYSNVAQCQRHPSQSFTGFCSSCLIERLSLADTAERRSNKAVSVDDEWKQESSAAVHDLRSKSCNAQTRRTLLSLFQLDDIFENEHARDNFRGMESSISAIRYHARENGSGDSRKEPQIDSNGEIGSNSEITRVIMEPGSSSLNNVNGNPDTLKRMAPLESENLKEKGLSTFLGSVFSRRILRTRSASKRNFRGPSELEVRFSAGFRHSQLGMDPSTSHTCVHKCSSDSDRAVWEDPRHSWDGVMMVKAACQPACAGIIGHSSTSVLHSRRKNLPEEGSASSTGTIDRTANASEEIFTCANTNVVDPVRDAFHEETQRFNAIPKLRRPHGCGKAWYRSITSPWRDLFNKRDNLLHRSLSESWRYDRREKTSESMKADGRVNFHATAMNSVEKQHDSTSKSINGDAKGFKHDSQSKDFRLGRSRSLHYSSPGNAESGLLRFYLTPLRRSRRARRQKTPRSFTWSILRF